MYSIPFLAAPVLTLFAFLCAYFLVWRKPSSTKRNKLKEAPQPAGALPIIGHLHQLARGGLPHITLGAIADKYGPAFLIRLGVHKVLVVSNSEISKECLTTNDKAFATRPNSAAAKLMGYDYAMFGFAPYDAYWREVRKVVMLEVLSTRRLESLKHVWDIESSTCIKELYQLWENKSKAQGPALIEMDQWFADMTLNVAVKLVNGKRYFGASADYSENEAKRCQKAMRDFFSLVGVFVVSDFLPYLWWLDLQGTDKEMKRTAREVDDIIQGWLDEHKRKRKSGETTSDQDFMDVMLTTLGDNKRHGYDADTINKSTCSTMILAGSDTTMVTLTWALSLLLNNPHVLKKAQDELDIHVGKDRHVKESDIKNLTYLNAIIKETLRLYPAAPLLSPHEATEDCVVAGYHVPAGTRLMVNAWKVQRDPLIWPNPNEFQPERFLNKVIDVKGQDFELIPFGSGRRACPGISLALQEVSLTLARLIHTFELTTPSESKVDMTESAGLVTAKAKPLEVLVTPRLASKFYV